MTGPDYPGAPGREEHSPSFVETQGARPYLPYPISGRSQTLEEIQAATANRRASRVNGLAVFALICAALGIGPLAVVIGHLALRELAFSFTQRGRPLAILALILGYLESAALVVALVAYLALTIMRVGAAGR